MFGTLQNMYRITIPSFFLPKRRSRNKEEEKEGKEKGREKKKDTEERDELGGEEEEGEGRRKCI